MQALIDAQDPMVVARLSDIIGRATVLAARHRRRG
jgi:hypothetical protein